MPGEGSASSLRGAAAEVAQAAEEIGQGWGLLQDGSEGSPMVEAEARVDLIHEKIQELKGLISGLGEGELDRMQGILGGVATAGGRYDAAASAFEGSDREEAAPIRAGIGVLGRNAEAAAATVEVVRAAGAAAIGLLNGLDETMRTDISNPLRGIASSAGANQAIAQRAQQAAEGYPSHSQ